MKFITLFVLVILIAGCTQNSLSTPAPVPPGVTIQVFATSLTAGPNTSPATDPSGAAINLINPPVLTTNDIATVAKSERTEQQVGGAGSPAIIPSLEINLNRAGTKKMLAATTNPASPTLAIVVNGTVISVPRIVQPIKGAFRVSGDHRDPKFLYAIAAATGQP